ncbi:class I SAM-dependent methyltransferase [Jiangella asiatica]|uniref:Class I SAM-dependent methyltransferase n=1 Tax=Jiangella asiatica TaxID=2530372 RepID=A0A4R5DCK6_9ACTN|nr:class I SAM-dependent methyltransferase [Jiangella asiatica]TDE11439.1 class I SAM-dependent methyltransferase [Jiangella asiatica]
MSDDPGAVVRTGYDAAMSSYARLEQARWPRKRWLGGLTTLLTPNAEVLDLGCATGVPTVADLATTFRVTGVDISPAQIEQARANVLAATFICDDLRTVDFTDGRFDAVVSLYTFDHVPRDQHGTLLVRIHRWLRPGGYLLLSIEDADEPGRTVEWLGVDMHFSMFDAQRTRQLVVDAGFVIVRTAVETQTEGNTEIPYTWILAQRAPEERVANKRSPVDAPTQSTQRLG